LESSCRWFFVKQRLFQLGIFLEFVLTLVICCGFGFLFFFIFLTLGLKSLFMKYADDAWQKVSWLNTTPPHKKKPKTLTNWGKISLEEKRCSRVRITTKLRSKAETVNCINTPWE